MSGIELGLKEKWGCRHWRVLELQEEDNGDMCVDTCGWGLSPARMNESCYHDYLFHCLNFFEVKLQ
ncbi:hypothetical protein Hanom_Chr15g01396011 [Helianthus anomalus]